MEAALRRFGFGPVPTATASAAAAIKPGHTIRRFRIGSISTPATTANAAELAATSTSALRSRAKAGPGRSLADLRNLHLYDWLVLLSRRLVGAGGNRTGNLSAHPDQKQSGAEWRKASGDCRNCSVSSLFCVPGHNHPGL